VADDRIAAVTVSSSATIALDGDDVVAFAVRDEKHHVGWTVLEGRVPVRSGEIMLGPRAADDVDARVGDQVRSVDSAGSATELVVVGVGLGPTVFEQRLGSDALVVPDDLARLGRSQPFTEALLRVAPGVERGPLVDEYAEAYEVVRARPPSDVQNLVELGRLPEALGLFLSLV